MCKLKTYIFPYFSFTWSIESAFQWFLASSHSSVMVDGKDRRNHLLFFEALVSADEGDFN